MWNKPKPLTPFEISLLYFLSQIASSLEDIAHNTAPKTRKPTSVQWMVGVPQGE